MGVRVCCLLALLPALSACIGVAVPVGLPDEEPFRPEAVGFLEPGVTTRHDIRAELLEFVVLTDEGEQTVTLEPVSFGEGEWWLYTHPRMSYEWAYLWVVGGGYQVSGGAGIAQLERDNLLLLHFDDEDVLTDYSVHEVNNRPCGDSPLCRKGDTWLLRAPDAINQRAHDPAASAADSCRVFVTSGTEDRLIFRIDKGSEQRILVGDSFAYEDVGPGHHALAVATPYSFGGWRDLDYPLWRRTFHCENRQPVYLNFDRTWPMERPYIEVLDAADGAVNLADRFLLISQDGWRLIENARSESETTP